MIEKNKNSTIKTFQDFANLANYSLMNTLTPDPQSTEDGQDHSPRQVFSGHFVPVTPTKIDKPIYITHSKNFFAELGICDTLAQSPDFMSMFSGDISNVPEPMSKVGWATGYALAIYGREYYEQCPFRTGNGYGDGRAVSVFEALIDDKRWEMQLKGGGRTPYCRGADGRAVLRSSVREFLAQEHMHAHSIPTSRSLSLYTSNTETVQRPWYSPNSYIQDPDRMVSETVAISTRVAPSFLRVGQIELFARRARKKEHPNAMKELEQIVSHLVEREYKDMIDKDLTIQEKAVKLAYEFRNRLTSLVANWIRVGFCQGNFNSDNCAAGGFTLDYGPFGFIDNFDPEYQSWTGGGQHFAFLNQPVAAEKNFHMFFSALETLLSTDSKHLEELRVIRNDFGKTMESKLQEMWNQKLGLESLEAESLEDLLMLMAQTGVDYTIFFRELSHIPDEFTSLEKSFYREIKGEVKLQEKWLEWFNTWKQAITKNDTISSTKKEELSSKMKSINPKYTLREWILVPAYEKAKEGDYSLIHELQEIMTNPYSEQSDEIALKYYKLKALEYFDMGGVSHMSCSS